jgi:hypothetical protein
MRTQFILAAIVVTFMIAIGRSPVAAQDAGAALSLVDRVLQELEVSAEHLVDAASIVKAFEPHLKMDRGAIEELIIARGAGSRPLVGGPPESLLPEGISAQFRIHEVEELDASRAVLEAVRYTVTVVPGREWRGQTYPARAQADLVGERFEFKWTDGYWHLVDRRVIRVS